MCLSDDYGWIVLNCLGNYKFVYNRALAELCKLYFVNFVNWWLMNRGAKVFDMNLD